MAKTRLDTLTADQAALLPVVRDEWLAHGLSCDLADRPEVERAMSDAYRVAKMDPPKITVWLDGPFTGMVGACLLASGQVWGQVRDQVWDQVRDQVGGQVRGQVRGQVWDQVRDQVGGQVRGQVRDQVWDQVWGQVRDQVGVQVWN